jgi:hypothetical protein
MNYTLKGYIPQVYPRKCKVRDVKRSQIHHLVLLSGSKNLRKCKKSKSFWVFI